MSQSLIGSKLDQKGSSNLSIDEKDFKDNE